MKTEEEVRKQLREAQEELKVSGKGPIGEGKWRRQKGYVDALAWVLGEDE